MAFFVLQSVERCLQPFRYIIRSGLQRILKQGLFFVGGFFDLAEAFNASQSAQTVQLFKFDALAKSSGFDYVFYTSCLGYISNVLFLYCVRDLKFDQLWPRRTFKL